MEKEIRARKTSRILGAALLFYMLLVLLYGQIEGMIHLKNETAHIAVLLVIQAALLILPTVAARLGLRRQALSLYGMRKTSRGQNALIGISSAGFLLAVEILYSAVFPTTVTAIGVTKQTSPPTLILLFLLYAVLPAVLEELFFRGTVMRALVWHGGALSILVSALAFGLMHISFTMFPIAFFGGLVLGSAYLSTGSSHTVAAVHFSCNAIWFAREAVAAFTGIPEQAFMRLVFAIAVMLSAIGIPTLRMQLSALIPDADAETAEASSFWSAPMILFLLSAVAAQILLGGVI